MSIDLSGVVVSEWFDDPKYPRRRSFSVKHVPRGVSAHDILAMPTLPRIGDEHPRCVTSGKPIACVTIAVERVDPKTIFVRCDYVHQYDLAAAHAAIVANEEAVAAALVTHFGRSKLEASLELSKFVAAVELAAIANSACGQ